MGDHIGQLLLHCFLYQLLMVWSANGFSDKEATDNPQRMWNPENGYILGEDVQTTSLRDVLISNETIQLGGTVFLNCQVRNIADKKVSWIRKRDNHILTSGLFTYTNDGRFRVIKPEGSDNWSLQIKFVQKRDEGRYECQVSTKTGRYGYLVNLGVAVPETSIVGPAEHHVQSGSTIFLICVIEGGIVPPQFVFWYRNNIMINYDQSRGGIKVVTEMQPKPSSTLTIKEARIQDSGNYTCAASGAEAASVSVFVSEGDKTAAIQRFGSGAESVCHSWWRTGAVFFIATILMYGNYYSSVTT